MIRILPGTRLYKHAVNRGAIKDELDFLKKGCPYVNVTKLSDDRYSLLSMKYSGYRDSSTALVKRPIEKREDLELSISTDGILTFYCYCPCCYEKNFIKTTIIHAKSTSLLNLYRHVCKKCYLHLVPGFVYIFDFDYRTIKNWIEFCLQPYLGSRIVVYGLTDVIKRFIMTSQILRNMIVKIVDINPDKFKQETYCGYSVETPEMLRDFDFDYILTPTVSEERCRVTNSLNNMGITPKFIEFLPKS